MQTAGNRNLFNMPGIRRENKLGKCDSRQLTSRPAKAAAIKREKNENKKKNKQNQLLLI